MAGLKPLREEFSTPIEREVVNSIDPDEVVELLQALIRQRSDYPPGDCRAAIQVASQKLTEAGILWQVLAREAHQPNLIATVGPYSTASDLLFHAHIDTVSAGEQERWSVDPFAGEVKDGRVYGRGSGDDKGSIAAQVMAFVALARARVQLAGCLRLAVVSDEESGGERGTRWLHAEGMLQTRSLVVGEQTDNRVAIAERVACGVNLTVFGKSAHGAMPWAGENAVLKAARALTWLQDWLFPRLQACTHPYLPPPTLNIGKIQGGIQWNIVPERCKVEMDRRLLPGETREAAVAEIRMALDEFAAQVESIQYELYSSGEVAANIDTSPDEPFVVDALQALRDISGNDLPPTGYVQTSDGRWFTRDGIPIILFGPGNPAVAHAPDEHIPVDQLIEAARFLALLALRRMALRST